MRVRGPIIAGMHRLASSFAVLAALAALAALAVPAPARADGTVVVKLSRGHRLHVAASAPIARLGLRVVRVAGDPAAAAARLARRPGVRWAEVNSAVHALGAAAVPNDPLYARGPLPRLGAPAAWQALGLGAFPAAGGVPVGVVDTGIDSAHEDLRGKVAGCASSVGGVVRPGACADGAGHGTHVSGTIGAIADDGVGLAGVAFTSPLIVCKALDDDGGGTDADVAACIRWVHDAGAKVISMSLGGAASRTIAEATRYAWEAGGRGGSVLVAAAGNDGTSDVEYPAGRAEVVSVAAVDGEDLATDFSNHNADVELAAPGVDVVSTVPGNRYAAMSGTSMATPHVSGAAALLWDARPRSTAASVRARLDAAVVDLGAPGRDPVFGFGRLDLAKAG
jgi:thermitase